MSVMLPDAAGMLPAPAVLLRDRIGMLCTHCARLIPRPIALPTICDVLPTSCDVLPTSCDVLPASCDVLSASCDVLSASCDELSASCDELSASCDELSASCDELSAFFDVLPNFFDVLPNFFDVLSALFDGLSAFFDALPNFFDELPAFFGALPDRGATLPRCRVEPSHNFALLAPSADRDFDRSVAPLTGVALRLTSLARLPGSFFQPLPCGALRLEGSVALFSTRAECFP